MDIKKIKTLGQLKKSGYQPKSVKEEIRNNLVVSIRNKENPFEGILGYEDTVIPDTERALLSRHNILFLGLRGREENGLHGHRTGHWVHGGYPRYELAVVPEHVRLPSYEGKDE